MLCQFVGGCYVCLTKNISRKPRTSPKASGVLKKTFALVQIQQILRTLQSCIQTLEEVVFLILKIEIFSLAATKMVSSVRCLTVPISQPLGGNFCWVLYLKINKKPNQPSTDLLILFGIPRILQRQTKTYMEDKISNRFFLQPSPHFLFRSSLVLLGFFVAQLRAMCLITTGIPNSHRNILSSQQQAAGFFVEG